jgi:hypothetical protein
MSTHNDHQDPDNQQPESSVIQPRPIMTFLIVLTVSTIFVFVIIKGLLYAFDRVDQANQPQPTTAIPEGLARKFPPEPRLQGAPGPNNAQSLLPLDEMREYRRQVDEKAESYGWVNKDAGVAHIPIERAKEMIVNERPLPVLPGALAEEIEKAESMRKSVLDAEPNGGRAIKKEQ